MIKITQQAVAAFKTFTEQKGGDAARTYSKSFGTTVVTHEKFVTKLVLHNNTIARHINGEGLSINLCGWNTPTTRERLNGLPGVNLTTRKGQAYLNGVAISDNGCHKVG